MKKSYRFIGWFIVLFLISCVYLFYFLAYIPSKEAKLFDRGFRILEDYGRNMNEKVNYFRSHLKNYGAFYFKDAYPSLAEKITNEIDDEKKDINFWEKDSVPEHLVEEVDYIKQITVPVNENIEFNLYKKKPDNTAGILHEKNTTYIVLPTQEIVKDLEVAANFNSYILSKIIENRYWKRNSSFTINPSYFFEGLKYDAVFESIVVFDKTEIIHSSSPNYNSLNINELYDTISRTHSAVIKNVKIRNDEKDLLILPHDFLSENIFIAGFISSETHKQRTRTINIELVFFLAGLILLLFTSFPLLKIVFISKQERLHTSDANLATISLIFCIGLAVILIFGSVRQFTYSKEHNKMRLEEISENTHSNIQKDLIDIFNIFSDIKNADCSNCNYCQIPKIIDSARNKKDYYLLPFELDCIDDTCPKELTRDFTDHIPLNDIIFIDGDGISRKSLTRNFKLYKYRNQLDLSNRDYYKKLKNKQTSWLWNDSIPFYIQSIKAYSSGAGEAAISINYKTSFATKTDSAKTKYLAITSTMPSVYSQVLPSDVQFTVINQNGETLFHSEKERNLHENFFEEIENKKLEAFIHTNKEKTLKVSYHGSNWFAHVKPIENTPIYLVTLIDRGRIQEKNARIILYSIYLLIVYILIVFLGTLIIKFTRPKNLLLKQKLYTFHWLVYRVSKEPTYKKLVVIVFILLIGQITGFYIYENIQIVLVYQFMIISASSYFTLSLLDSGTDEIRKIKKDRTGKLIILFLTLFFLARILHFIYSISKTENGIPVLLAILPLVFFIAAFILFRFFTSAQISKSLFALLKKHEKIVSYKLLMGLWLILLSVFPASHILKSVSAKENIIWSRFELNHLAMCNLKLFNNYELNKKDKIYNWFTRTQGDKTDSYSVKLFNENIVPEDSTKLKGSYYYELLPTEYFRLFNEELNPFLYHKDALDKAYFKNNSLYKFIPSLNKTLVIVDNQKKITENAGFFNRGAIFILILILSIAIYFLFQYLLNHLLYANFNNWIKPKTPDWFSCLSNENYKRIILISFNYGMYIEETKKLFPVYEVKHNELDTIEKNKFILENKKNMVFITGLEWNITDGDKHIEILNKIDEIILKTKATIIICSPFELEFINISLFDYFGGDDMNAENKNNYNSILGKWETIFQNFFKYVGHSYNENDSHIIEYNKKGELGKLLSREFSIDPLIIESFKKSFFTKEKESDHIYFSQRKKEELILGIQQFLEPRFYFIWKHCTPLEKVVLYDLADDGMLNIKNQYLINRLISKKLIMLEPEPRIFSESFRNFILTSVREEEAKKLEKKLSENGQWSNIRFLVITIILAIAIFVFVIQGKSIDKVLAVMTSFLALIPAIFKIFNGGMSFRFTK